MKKRIYLLLAFLICLFLLGFALFHKNTELENEGIYLDESYTAKAVGQRIQYIVLHFTHGSLKASLNTLTQGHVSAHYLIPEEPIQGKKLIYQLVPDDLKAAQAGLSYWQGHERDGQINLNTSSLGIELVNPGFRVENNVRIFYPYSEYQIDVLIKLLHYLVEKYDIDPTHIVGHSDITPNIKARGGNIRIDPGPLFPWEKLAQAGIGAWYDEDSVAELLKNDPEEEINIRLLQENLARYGYNIEITGKLDQQTRNVVSAFQMHFRPSDYSGIPDQQTDAILKNLIDKYFSGAST
ncbi:MAG: N-acetylmuramoyl-L-alanine amidase [Legionellales bacterium]|jgi:N-acetylmuramoyl-L-alanine amidase